MSAHKKKRCSRCKTYKTTRCFGPIKDYSRVPAKESFLTCTMCRQAAQVRRWRRRGVWLPHISLELFGWGLGIFRKTNG